MAGRTCPRRCGRGERAVSGASSLSTPTSGQVRTWSETFGVQDYAISEAARHPGGGDSAPLVQYLSPWYAGMTRIRVRDRHPCRRDRGRLSRRGCGGAVVGQIRGSRGSGWSDRVCREVPLHRRRARFRRGVDYKNEDVRPRSRAAVLTVHVYFDNVGGEILDNRPHPPRAPRARRPLRLGLAVQQRGPARPSNYMPCSSTEPGWRASSSSTTPSATPRRTRDGRLDRGRTAEVVGTSSTGWSSSRRRS